MGRLLDRMTFGPARRRRDMSRRLRELDRTDAASRSGRYERQSVPSYGRDWSAASPKSAGSRADGSQSANRHPVAVMIAVVLIGASVYGLVRFAPWKSSGKHSSSSSSLLSAPPAGVGAAPSPLGHPAAAPAGSGGYAFEQTQTGSTTDPVTWDPCRAIHYVISGTAPAGAAQLVPQAVAAISRASGLHFVYDGTTKEQPSSAARAAYQPTVYGARWAPLLISWTTPTQEADLAGGIIGLGGAYGMTAPDGRITYVTGDVSLDAPQIAQVLARGGPPAATMQAVVLHELGHALGLAHVSDPTQVMYPEAQIRVTALGAGDRRGLAALGTGKCEPGL